MDYEKEITQLKFELDRAKAVNECNNIMGKYVFYMKACTFHMIAPLFARRDDSRVEMAWGVYDGHEGVTRCYSYMHAETLPPPHHGMLYIHPLTTSVIEVAADGQTARATYISPGAEGFVEDGKGEAYWCWIKYGVEFIKVDGKWYLWHLSTYGTFMCDFYKSFAEENHHPAQINTVDDYPPKWKPDRPVTHHDWQYATDVPPELDPAPPLPYETFADIGYGY